jgi:hypothetical protein
MWCCHDTDRTWPSIRYLLTKVETRRIAANTAKLPEHYLELLCHSCVNARENFNEIH